MRRPLMRVVERSSSPGITELPPETEEMAEHSLHGLVRFRSTIRPTLIRFIIDQLTSKRGVILDPFCGSGSVALETYLLGRRPLAYDNEPLFASITRAKLEPIDIADAALFLQLIDFRKPVSLESYTQGFHAYFDSDTFREIVVLRSQLRKALTESGPGDAKALPHLPTRLSTRTARFLSASMLGVLHGHTVGYLSSYSSPYESLDPEAQEKTNRARGASPGYRAVAPRVLRKIAHLARDCRPSMFKHEVAASDCNVADPRNLLSVDTGVVDLVCTHFPLPLSPPRLEDQWLRRWFYGTPTEQLADLNRSSLHEWQEYSAEILFELARVTRREGWAALIVSDVNEGRTVHQVDELLGQIVETSFAEYWKVDQVLIARARGPKVKDALRERSNSNGMKVVILRRM